MDTTKNVRDPETYAIIGAAMEVHRVLGHGFHEEVYQEALAIEFEARAIPFVEKLDLIVMYKQQSLSCRFKPDFICFGKVIVEIKALNELAGPQRSQLLNYLKATNQERGLLLNFGSERLQYERLVFTPQCDRVNENVLRI
jgi:GxxExxY protein